MKKRRLSRRFSPADKEALHASAAEISQCLKLLTQNKINEKNCFDLPLSSLLHETKQGAEFERASVLLETGAAIYGKRVDNALQATHQVRERLFRTKQDKTRKVVKADTENKTASKKALVTKTLEAKAERISVKEVMQVFQVDPLFRKMSRTFDKGGAQGMLLNNLTVSKGCRVKLDSSGSCHADESANSEFVRDEEAQSMFESIAALVPSDMASRAACPMLDKLEALVVSVTEDNTNIAAPAAAMEEHYDDDDDFDDDGGFADDFGDFLPEANPESGEAPTSLSSSCSAAEPDRRSSMSMMVTASAPFDLEGAIRAGSVNDFAFFDPAMASRLPRPKRARRATQKAAGGARAKVARKAKFTLDFSAQSALSADDRAELFKKPKKQGATQLAKKSLKTASTLNDLPAPMPRFAVSALSKMFLNPRLSILCRAMVAAERREGGGGGVADAEAGEEAFGDADEWDAGGDEMEDDFVVEDNRAMSFGADENEFLIEAETQVDKLDIHYETVHKRVDVKSLKANLWTSVSEKITTEHVDAEASSADKSANMTFTDAVSNIAGGMPSAVTVPVLFICVLHLANEKGLRLSNGCADGDLACMRDFVIQPMDTDEVL